MTPNKITLTLNPLNGGPFNCLPARTIELESERILCNDIVLPFESHPHNIRLWVIGNEYGALGAVWAGCKQDALDELIDRDLGQALLVSKEDQATADDDEQEEWTCLGNAGEPCDLTNVWMQTVNLANDLKLCCQFAEARGASFDTLTDL